MTMTQTVEITADRRTIEVPREIPSGATIITFTPAPKVAAVEDDCPLCAKYRDPKSGALIPNAETIAAIEEGRAMMRGEIPANRFNSFDEMWENLMKNEND